LVAVTTIGMVPAGARAGSGAALPRQASTSDGITVQAGVNDPRDPTVVITEFAPARVRVLVGSTVTWDWKGAIEPHSVTFFPPGQAVPPPGSDESLFLPTPPTGPYDGSTLVNSGLLPFGPVAAQPFAVEFAKAGRFQYHCVIHPRMIGTVTAVEPRGARVDSAETAAARGKRELARWTAEGLVAKRRLDGAKEASTKNPDGSTTWDVEMGSTTAHTDILAFAPTSKSVKAGDSVRFVNGSEAPHTATFNGTQPGITSPLDPRTATAIPGPSPQTVNSTELFNTGELPPDAAAPGEQPPPEAARSFEFRVPASGHYEYYCIPHTLSGMGGQVDAT
jgi:plastocyanin